VVPFSEQAEGISALALQIRVNQALGARGPQDISEDPKKSWRKKKGDQQSGLDWCGEAKKERERGIGDVNTDVGADEKRTVLALRCVA
jgi:hypothetical protein